MNKIKSNKYGIFFLLLVGFIVFLAFGGFGCSNVFPKNLVSIQHRIDAKQGKVVQKNVVQECVDMESNCPQQIVEHFKRIEESAPHGEVEEEVAKEKVVDNLSNIPWYLIESCVKQQKQDRIWQQYLSLDDEIRKQYHNVWTNEVSKKGFSISQTILPSWYKGWMWNEYQGSRM